MKVSSTETMQVAASVTFEFFMSDPSAADVLVDRLAERGLRVRDCEWRYDADQARFYFGRVVQSSDAEVY